MDELVIPFKKNNDNCFVIMIIKYHVNVVSVYVCGAEVFKLTGSLFTGTAKKGERKSVFFYFSKKPINLYYLVDEADNL